MDAVNVTRPAVVAAQAATIRAENLVSINRVKTELPKPSSITGVSRDEPVRLDLSNPARDQARREAQLRETVQRNLTIEPQTRTVVFQAVNSGGEIVRQVPSEAALKLRAYYRAMAKGRDEQGDDAIALYRESERVERNV